ncbi:MAG: hypothetical protein Q9162_005735 [Coniocarpon cinnabarinum]
MFFGSPKYLTVSSQLHLEALAQSVGKVWTLSPTFRAEKSETARHLSEFYMLEAEEYCVTELEDVMGTVEQLIRAIAQGLQSSDVVQELRMWHSQSNEGSVDDPQKVDIQHRWKMICQPQQWARITYHEAVKLLQEAESKGNTFASHVDVSSGLQTEHERYLADRVGQGAPVFVTDYPRAIKPFYMAPSQGPQDRLGPVETVACFDLLMPDVCEVVGGSMREHRLEVLESSMREKGLLKGGSVDTLDASGTKVRTRDTKSGLDWYLDLRRYGSAPHGGFGLGFDRLLAYLAGVKNVRDVVTFPRWHKRCDC